MIFKIAILDVRGIYWNMLKWNTCVANSIKERRKKKITETEKFQKT